MKKLILLSVFCIVFIAVKAQDPIFVKGDKAINLGLGIGYYANFSISGEYCILDGIADKGSIGAGAYAGIGFSLFNLYYSHSTNIVGGVRGTFHYPFVKKLDTYGGLGLGLDYRAWKYYSDDIYPDFNPFVGARYSLSDNFKVFAELGYGYMGNLIVGISFAF
jgi:hypothetical protein